MKRFRLLTAALTLGLSVGAASLAATALPASAAAPATHATQVTHVASARDGGGVVAETSDGTCIYLSDFFVVWNSSCTTGEGLRCSEGNAESYPAGFVPGYAYNDCGVRAWIYQGAVRAGYNLCINPASHTGILQKLYTYGWVSGNEDDC